MASAESRPTEKSITGYFGSLQAGLKKTLPVEFGFCLT
jgi:hypothetical protein